MMTRLSDEQVRELREMAVAGIDDEELARHYRLTVGRVVVLRTHADRTPAGGPVTRRKPRDENTMRAELRRLRADVRELQHAVAVLLGSALERTRAGR